MNSRGVANVATQKLRNSNKGPQAKLLQEEAPKPKLWDMHEEPLIRRRSSKPPFVEPRMGLELHFEFTMLLSLETGDAELETLYPAPKNSTILHFPDLVRVGASNSTDLPLANCCANTMDIISLLIALLEGHHLVGTISNLYRTTTSWVGPRGAEKKSPAWAERFAHPRRPHHLTSVRGSRLAAASWLRTGIPEVTVQHKEGTTFVFSRHAWAWCPSLKVDELAQKPVDVLQRPSVRRRSRHQFAHRNGSSRNFKA